MAAYLELYEAAEEPPHVAGGNLHDVDRDSGQHTTQPNTVQKPTKSDIMKCVFLALSTCACDGVFDVVKSDLARQGENILDLL